MNKYKEASFDEIKKRNEIISNAVVVAKQEEVKTNRIVYFLNQTMDIAYIGSSSGYLVDLEVYIGRTLSNRLLHSYSVEEWKGEDFEEALAERILVFSPYENKQLPPNNKYISIGKAKTDYRIDKRTFKNFIKKWGGYELNGILYGLKNEFLEEFGFFEPFLKDIPKIGQIIITRDCLYWEDLTRYGMSLIEQTIERVQQQDGEIVEIFTAKRISKAEIERRNEAILNSSWKVTEVSTTYFKAIKIRGGKLKTFFGDEVNKSWVMMEHHLKEEIL